MSPKLWFSRWERATPGVPVQGVPEVVLHQEDPEGTYSFPPWQDQVSILWENIFNSFKPPKAYKELAQWSVLCKSGYFGITPEDKIVIIHFRRVFNRKCFRVPLKRKETFEDGKWETFSEPDRLRIQHQRCIQRAEEGEWLLRRNSCMQWRPDPSSQGNLHYLFIVNIKKSCFFWFALPVIPQLQHIHNIFQCKYENPLNGCSCPIFPKRIIF